MVVVLLVGILVCQAPIASRFAAWRWDAEGGRREEAPLSRDESAYLAETGRVAEFVVLAEREGWDVALRALRVETALVARSSEKWAHLAHPR